ncbi:hypothetical protein RQP55_04415 [Novosphingobium sp. APW14]|uniref:hypothetical protein n=1 Tax=Novosphingobium sp. APW14 TaxID=3077237 RepID=UPI0028DF841C|nr:hypothetical protein [Novosphingobium sp. APW14]MDT9012673.1 hypothetical protein [Novosphingobium sp. APW14]
MAMMNFMPVPCLPAGTIPAERTLQGACQFGVIAGIQGNLWNRITSLGGQALDSCAPAYFLGMSNSRDKANPRQFCPTIPAVLNRRMQYCPVRDCEKLLWVSSTIGLEIKKNHAISYANMRLSMGINEIIYRRPAVRGDVSGTAITTSIALNAIASALEAIANGQAPSAAQIAKIREQAVKLDKIFDDLTGYTP